MLGVCQVLNCIIERQGWGHQGCGPQRARVDICLVCCDVSGQTSMGRCMLVRADAVGPWSSKLCWRL